MKETQEQMDATLAELRNRMSPKTYEVFHRRFLDRQSAREAAAALGMTSEAVDTRHCRAMNQWRTLTRGSALAEYGGDSKAVCPPPSVNRQEILEFRVPPQNFVQIFCFAPKLLNKRPLTYRP